MGSTSQMVWLFEATIEPFHVYIVLRPPSFSCSGTQPCKKQYHFQVSVHIVKKLDEKLPKILQQTFIYSSLPFFVWKEAGQLTQRYHCKGQQRTGWWEGAKKKQRNRYVYIIQRKQVGQHQIYYHKWAVQREALTTLQSSLGKTRNWTTVQLADLGTCWDHLRISKDSVIIIQAESS